MSEDTVARAREADPASAVPAVPQPSRYAARALVAGEWVFRENDLGTEMFIIQDGEVEILKRVGEEDRRLALLEKGDFFGEMALLEGLPRAAGARTVGPVRLLAINGATFDQMLRDNPEIAVRMMRKLSRRLRATDALLRELTDRETASADGTGQQQSVQSAPSARPDETRVEAPERLVHLKSKMEFALTVSSETTIGRGDPVTGIAPDIDLSPVDGKRSISRRHAKIYRRGVKFFLAEEIGTMNGTFVNDERLETGVPTRIRPGDRLRFGVVDTVFQSS